MNTAAEVLIIIVSAALSIFLFFATFAIFLIIKVLREIRALAQKAEKIADKAEAVGEFFEKSAGPAALFKLIAHLVQTIKSKKERG